MGSGSGSPLPFLLLHKQIIRKNYQHWYRAWDRDRQFRFHYFASKVLGKTNYNKDGVGIGIANSVSTTLQTNY